MPGLPSQTSAISLFVNSIVLLPAYQAQDLSIFVLPLATRFHTVSSLSAVTFAPVSPSLFIITACSELL